MSRSVVRVSTFAAVSVLAGAAAADPVSPPALLGTLRGLPPALLVGSFGGGHGHGVRAPRGVFLGVDTGWAWLLGMSDVEARTLVPVDRNGWCYGARFGYQFASGVAIQARYDKLGVSAPDASGDLAVASAGVRYSVPVVPMPFAEALVGPAFHGTSTSPIVGLGVGASVFVARHVGFDVALRDWIVDLGGVHHIPTVTLGISAGFGG